MEKQWLTGEIMTGSNDNQTTPEWLKIADPAPHVPPRTTGWIWIPTPHRIPDPIASSVGVPMLDGPVVETQC